MSKKEKIGSYVTAIALIVALTYMVLGNPTVFVNNQRLKQAVKAVKSDNVKLNEIVPFKWDVVYTFDPYTSKEKIEDIIGFKSNSIKETVSEGMVQLLFIKDKKVVCSVRGYSSTLGYSINFFGKIKYEDNAIFLVKMDSDIIWLSHKK